MSADPTSSRLRLVLARARSPRGVACIIAFVVLFAIGFVPLFDGPGYEHAIASGLVIPALAAILTAIEGYDGPRNVAGGSPLDLVLRGLQNGALLAGVALLTAYLHVLRVGACDPLGGTATFGLTAFAGSLLGGVAGAVAAIVTAHVLKETRRRRRYAIALAFAAPLTTALVALWLFYATPAVFAFDPYVGFFSGTLYDEVVDAYAPLLTYRAGTALTIAAVVVLAAAIGRAPWGKWVVVRRRRAVAGGILAASSLTLAWFGPELGHRTSRSHIEHTLGGHRSGPRCDVWYPQNQSEGDAALLLRDCEEEIAAVEKRLGTRGPEHITAFFFRDAAQKRLLMGAADTYVAKPWRREVYLQVAPYPHPVLGHELAHVIASSFGHGPFGIAGDLGGLVPNPGLVEGVAVAASHDKDELTPAQWAHAMKQLELLPKLSKIFGGGFFATNSSTAYTVAGAFIGWLIDEGRADGVRAWYGGRSFDAAFGRSFAEMESTWRASLDAVPLPPEALAVAKGRFDRPGIWGRRCPHVVERLREDADACHERGDLDAEEHLLGALLRLDVADPGARMDRAKIARDRGDRDGYFAQLQALMDDERVSSNWRNRAREAMADELLRAGRLAEAHAIYDLARKEVIDEDWSRTLDVKSFVSSTPERTALFARMFVRQDPDRDDTMAVVVQLATFLAQGQGGPEELSLARYLVARRLFEAKAYDECDRLLAVDPRPLDAISLRLRREVGRMRLMIACLAPADVATRKTKVGAVLAEYEAAPAANLGRREGIIHLAERCAGM
jgi:hypothetical protein